MHAASRNARVLDRPHEILTRMVKYKGASVVANHEPRFRGPGDAPHSDIVPTRPAHDRAIAPWITAKGLVICRPTTPSRST